jgi:UDP-N-acetylmuramyl pentapeptide phosphotransferase/UDP-N-acetylglucosamine-1-phosphate transferase
VRFAGVVVVAALVALVTWRAGRSMFAAPVLARRNHRGIDVPVGAGILLVVAAVVVETGLRLHQVIADGAPPADLPLRGATLVAALAFCLLGLFDDLVGTGDDRGFRGHLRALAQGRLTTGGLKLVAGGVVAVAVAATLGETLLDVALGSLVIALAANLANLFDRAPGRTAKVGLLAGAVVVAAAPATARPSLTGLALVLGATAGLLVADLREELMLGDAGSNVIGAALGVAVVATFGRTAEVAVLVALLVLNLASERVSFSSVIDRVAPLRALDRLGRLPNDPAPPST